MTLCRTGTTQQSLIFRHNLRMAIRIQIMKYQYQDFRPRLHLLGAWSRICYKKQRQITYLSPFTPK
jgi:hypothetical protein